MFAKVGYENWRPFPLCKQLPWRARAKLRKGGREEKKLPTIPYPPLQFQSNVLAGGANDVDDDDGHSTLWRERERREKEGHLHLSHKSTPPPLLSLSPSSTPLQSQKRMMPASPPHSLAGQPKPRSEGVLQSLLPHWRRLLPSKPRPLSRASRVRTADGGAVDRSGVSSTSSSGSFRLPFLPPRRRSLKSPSSREQIGGERVAEEGAPLFSGGPPTQP